MSKKQTDIFSSLVIIAGCIVFWAQTAKFAPQMPGDIGSGTFPRIILVCIVVMCVLKMVLAFFNNTEDYTKPSAQKNSDYFRGVFSIVLLGAYVFLFKKLGFLLTSVCYLFLQLLLLSNKERRTGKYILLYATISILLPLIVQIFFVNVLRLMLPTGVLTNILL